MGKKTLPFREVGEEAFDGSTNLDFSMSKVIAQKIDARG